MRKIVFVVLMIFITLFSVVAFAADDTPRMTKEQLKARLGDADLMVIDVRTPSAWTQSAEKIKGAVREDPAKVDTWMAKYPKDKVYVFYCT